MSLFTSLKVSYVWGGRRVHMTWFHKIRFMFVYFKKAKMLYFPYLKCCCGQTTWRFSTTLSDVLWQEPAMFLTVKNSRVVPVLQINPFAPMMQYTIFALMAKKRASWALWSNVWWNEAQNCCNFISGIFPSLLNIIYLFSLSISVQKHGERPIMSGNWYWTPVVAALPSGLFLKIYFRCYL